MPPPTATGLAVTARSVVTGFGGVTDIGLWIATGFGRVTNRVTGGKINEGIGPALGQAPRRFRVRLRQIVRESGQQIHLINIDVTAT